MSNYLIIGASSGIGKAVSFKLAEQGHRIYGTFNKNGNYEMHPNIEYSHLNVLDTGIDLNFLPDKLDGVVYCPGSILLKPFARIKPDEFTSDYNLQVVGAVKVIQAVLSKLKNTSGAAIVFFSTVAVQTGLPYHTLVSASKGAVEGITVALSAELAPKIRVNCIAPSLTDTPLAASLLNSEQKKESNAQRHPLKRIGTVDDIGNMTEFLLSPKSDWITGQIFHVDGGLSKIRT